MDFLDAVVAAGVAAIISLAAFTFALYKSRSQDPVAFEPVTESSEFTELLRSVSARESELESASSVGPQPSNEGITVEVLARLISIEARISDLSEKATQNAVRDAVLSTRLDALEAIQERSGESALSRWDVATTVFALFGGLSALTGLIFAGLEYVTQL